MRLHAADESGPESSAPQAVRPPSAGAAAVFVSSVSGLLGRGEELGAEMGRIVVAEAPRLFAIVEEFDESDDEPVPGWVAAWGMAFDDYAEVVVPQGARMRVGTPQDALQLLSIGGIEARLVWLSPAA